jgi:heme/copper-type cytochrome/quinol oxidase subunit 4
MTNIDEKIKQDISKQAQELDELMQSDDGLISYLKVGFSSKFAWLVKMGYALAIVLSIIMIYCGIKFFNAPAQEQLFWGVCLIISFNAQVATKLWVFMHTNRNHLAKEIRLLELRLGNRN